ncbi:MAG: uracil-DNA glycosylase family protein [Undibacterium sp.]|nr:uracil-DNA glycosylase family protein [Undibacterium sp.]
MNHQQENMLAEMGIGPIWKLRENESVNTLPVRALVPQQTTSHLDDKASVISQATTKNVIVNADNTSSCLVCGRFHASHAQSNAVFWSQAAGMKCLFIYESVFDSENAQAESLIAASDILLTNILRALNMQRGVNACIVNIVTGNPHKVNDSQENKDEILVCVDCLKTQIDLIDPSIIVSLGKTAAISLLGLDSNTAINDLRGRLHQYGGKPMTVTFDPMYLLSHPMEKSSVWSDLCLALNSIEVH